MMIKYQNFVKAMSRKNALILANQTIGKILRFWEKYILNILNVFEYKYYWYLQWILQFKIFTENKPFIAYKYFKNTEILR